MFCTAFIVYIATSETMTTYALSIFLNMGTRMKTTIELSDPLFQSAKQLAQQNQTTLRALLEEGLRRVLADSQGKPKPAFKLKNASVRGKQMLIANPRQWHDVETEQLAKLPSRAVKS